MGGPRNKHSGGKGVASSQGGGDQTEAEDWADDQDQTAPLTAGNLKLELDRMHKPLLEEFSKKVEVVAAELKSYVDQEVSLLVERISKVEKKVDTPGPENWLVIQNLKQDEGETPPLLQTKVEKVFRAIGVESPVTQCFRRGRSDNPRYVPIVKVELSTRAAADRIRSESRRLKQTDFSDVFIRESRPQHVRDQEHNIRALAKSQGLTFARGRIQARN